MKMKLLIVLFFTGLSLPVWSQDEQANPDNSLSAQFKEMKDEANNYQQYKVVKEVNLNTFWKNVQDTLEVKRQEIQEANNKINAQQQEIVKLTSDVETRDQNLVEANSKIANLSVLGMEVNKETFVVTFWVVLAVLLAIIAFIFYKHYYSKQYAVKKHNEYEELDREFADYKIRAREKETRLMRDLQTERNRIEELSQRGTRGK